MENPIAGYLWDSCRRQVGDPIRPDRPGPRVSVLVAAVLPASGSVNSDRHDRGSSRVRPGQAAAARAATGRNLGAVRRRPAGRPCHRWVVAANALLPGLPATNRGRPAAAPAPNTASEARPRSVTEVGDELLSARPPEHAQRSSARPGRFRSAIPTALRTAIAPHRPMPVPSRCPRRPPMALRPLPARCWMRGRRRCRLESELPASRPLAVVTISVPLSTRVPPGNCSRRKGPPSRRPS